MRTTPGCDVTASHAGLQAAFDADYDAVQQDSARKDRLDELIEEMATTSEYADTVRRLGCLRGVATLPGFALAVGIGDWNRFTGSSIGAFLGLVPCGDAGPLGARVGDGRRTRWRRQPSAASKVAAGH